jgi:hypothetical protein
LAQGRARGNNAQKASVGKAAASGGLHRGAFKRGAAAGTSEQGMRRARREQRAAFLAGESLERPSLKRRFDAISGFLQLTSKRAYQGHLLRRGILISGCLHRLAFDSCMSDLDLLHLSIQHIQILLLVNMYIYVGILCRHMRYFPNQAGGYIPCYHIRHYIPPFSPEWPRIAR